MAGSMGVYVPAVVFQRAVALGRVFLFIHLLSKAQYGLWGLGAMVFTLGASVMTLGSHMGVARYVSFYEARGLLREFYRRVRWGVLVIAILMTALAFAASAPLTDLLIISRVPDSQILREHQLFICWAALANAMLMALYHNMQSFMAGMRVYRLASAVEICYTVIFTISGAVSLWIMPAALSVLLVHAASLLAALLIGSMLLHAGLKQTRDSAAGQAPPVGEEKVSVLEPTAEVPEITGVVPLQSAAEARPDGTKGAFQRVLRFGSVALLGSLLWLAAGYVSFWMTSRRLGQEQAGGFYAFFQLGHLILYLANAAWAVVFTHVARRWEANDRDTAMFTLQTAYKAVAMAVMTVTILIHACSGIWIRLLPQAYRDSLPLLGGLLMLFQVMSHLALLTILANLHRRPIFIALTALAGAGVNAALAHWWLPIYGPVGAAWAAGLGMYVGAGAVTMGYLLASRVSLQRSTVFVFGSPALLLLLLLPAWWTAGAVWAAVLIAAIATPWLFTQRQKRILVSSVNWARAFRKRGR